MHRCNASFATSLTKPETEVVQVWLAAEEVVAKLPLARTVYPHEELSQGHPATSIDSSKPSVDVPLTQAGGML